MSHFRRTDTIRSWGGVLRASHLVAYPQWGDELPQVVQDARDRGLSLLSCGARRSYGDSGLNPDGALVDMSRLDRIVTFDPIRRIVKAEGGVSFDTLLRLFVRQGFFIPVTPGTRFVTLAGAIANDVHGKNHHVNGTIGRWVRKIGLLTSTGEELVLSPETNPALFRATIGGLGLTGIITWAELELMPVGSAMMDAENISFGNLSEFFQLSEESHQDFDYTVSWIDCLSSGEALGRGIFTRGNHAPKGSPLPAIPQAGLAMPVNLPGFVLNKYSINAFNSLYYHNGRRKAARGLVSMVPFFYPLDAIGHWNRMYGNRGMYQYQSVIPPSEQFYVTKDMLNAIAKAGQGSFLAVLKTFGDCASPGLLSFPMPGTTLALDFPNRGEDTLKLMARLDAIVREANGRLYPAKDGRMTAEMFRHGYKNWEEFAQYVDPGFSSHFWKRVAHEGVV